MSRRLSTFPNHPSNIKYVVLQPGCILYAEEPGKCPYLNNLFFYSRIYSCQLLIGSERRAILHWLALLTLSVVMKLLVRALLA